jgi:hypothetical protein
MPPISALLRAKGGVVRLDPAPDFRIDRPVMRRHAVIRGALENGEMRRLLGDDGYRLHPG